MGWLEVSIAVSGHIVRDARYVLKPAQIVYVFPKPSLLKPWLYREARLSAARA